MPRPTLSPAALRALARDPRADLARAVSSPDPYLGNAAAYHLEQWKIEAAAALGWDATATASAHLETVASLRAALRSAA